MEGYFLTDHFAGMWQKATALSPVSFPLESFSNSPEQEQPLLSCWSGLIFREAKAEQVLGGSNIKETFRALQSARLGVIKEEESRHCKAQVSKGKV